MTRRHTQWPPVWRSERWPSGRPWRCPVDARPSLDREHRHPPAFVRRLALAAAVVLLALVGWFAVELSTDGAWIGLTERLAAAAEAGVPLAAVLLSRRRSGPSGPG